MAMVVSDWLPVARVTLKFGPTVAHCPSKSVLSSNLSRCSLARGVRTLRTRRRDRAHRTFAMVGSFAVAGLGERVNPRHRRGPLTTASGQLRRIGHNLIT